ncbi:MAG: hypothetical protein JXA36_03370 [Coriobacteriia bacterium]|nr:hypothetical protein [Coriobacteriia bacterium]
MTVTVRICPNDTWHFTASRAHDDGGVGVGSMFPPGAWTVAGAVRTAIGDHLGVEWGALARGDGRRHRLGDRLDLLDVIGVGDDLGQLRFSGPWVGSTRGRLFRAPSMLVETSGRELARLRVGHPIECDLGRVALPVSPESGITTLHDHWLTASGMAAALSGDLPAATEVISQSSLMSKEGRLGIELDRSTRTAVDGQLYQTTHLRPVDGSVSIEVDVSGIDRGMMPEASALRFGGEGRIAHIEVTGEAGAIPEVPVAGTGVRGLVLVLLTHADLDGGWLPPGAQRIDGDDTRWRVVINETEVVIRSAIIGRARREGGWDLVQRAPRPVRSLVPAGSVWYCEVPAGDLATAASALHGASIGRDQALGRGILAAGLWVEREHPEGQG